MSRTWTLHPDGHVAAVARARHALVNVGSIALTLAFMSLIQLPLAAASAAQTTIPLVKELVPAVTAPPETSGTNFDRREIVDRRTRTSRTVRNDDGSLTTTIATSSIHFQDEIGGWQSIDPRLVPSSEAGYAWQNAANRFRVLFKQSLSGGRDFMRVDVGGRSFPVRLIGGATNAADIDDASVTYRGVFPGVDLRYDVIPDGIKETLVLANRRTPTDYTFRIGVPKDADVRTAARSDGSVAVFIEPYTEPFFVLGPSYMTDSETGSASRSPKAAASLNATRVGDEIVVVAAIDRAWLLSPQRVFPVYLDPQITIQPDSTDRNFDANCGTCAGTATPELKIGAEFAGFNELDWWAALKFDLSAIPSGATIQSASLGLHFTRDHCIEFEPPPWGQECREAFLELYELFSDWTNPATRTDDLDFGGNPLAAFYLYGSPPGTQWMTWDHPNVAEVVEDWVRGATANHGFLVQRYPGVVDIGGPLVPGGAQGGAAAPKLEATYAPDQPPTTPTLGLPLHAGVVGTVVPNLTATSSDPEGDTVEFQFEVYRDAGLTQPAFPPSWVPTGSHFVPSTCPPTTGTCLKDGASYWWRARARDEYGTTSGWSETRRFDIRLLKLGSRDYWPMWSRGGVAVNLSNGNLTSSAPGPSYPTATGTFGASLTYNSLDTADRGLGVGWKLVAGDELGRPPTKLVDKSLVPPPDRLEASEVTFSDGSVDTYSRVGLSNTYVATPGGGSQLTKNANGTWSLLDADGAIYDFGSANPSSGEAPLASAELASAGPGKGRLVYQFSPQDPRKLLSITDEAAPGRQLQFAWTALGASCPNAVLCITGPDNVTWRYFGMSGTSGQLHRVSNGTHSMAMFGYDGTTGYLANIRNANDIHQPPGYDPTHDIAIAYAANRVASVVDGPTPSQFGDTMSTWTFTYVPGTVQTSPTRATHADVALGTRRLAEGYTTVRPPRQQPSGATTRTYYDTVGHQMETVDLTGSYRSYSYDDRDRLLWSEDAVGNPTDHTYEAVTDAIIEVAGPDPDGSSGSHPRVTTRYRYDERKIGSLSKHGQRLDGLQGWYYANPNLAGRPSARQTDSSVNFSWGQGGPGAVCPAPPDPCNSFSVRWKGYVDVERPGDYTFTTFTDDGVRLVIDETEAISAWQGAAGWKTSTPRFLATGLHTLTLEYYEDTGNSEVQLQWACATCTPSIPQAVIPPTALRPGWMNRTSKISQTGRMMFHHFAEPDSGRADYDLILDGSDKVITSYRYDPFGRLIEKIQPKGNINRTIAFNGDLQGTPLPGFETTWDYYGLGQMASPPAECGPVVSLIDQAQLLRSTTPHGLTSTSSVYDAAGRSIATTNGRGTTCRTFDAEGRLLTEKAPTEAMPVSYEYDPIGQRVRISSSTGEITTMYDEQGRVRFSRDSYGSATDLVYDSEGNTVERTSSTGGLSALYTTTFAYDIANRVVAETDPAGRQYAFFYDDNGRLLATQYPNHTFSWTDYNAAGWITAVYNRHGDLPTDTRLPSTVPLDPLGAIADFTYAYDNEGRKVEEIRSGWDLPVEWTRYSYDALGRISLVTFPSALLRRYNYDRNSNRVQIAEGNDPLALIPVEFYEYQDGGSPGLDQLSTVTRVGVGQTSFQYDSDGQVTNRGPDVLSWDGRGRLTGGQFATGTVNYEFDALGRRRSREAAGTPTSRYLFAGDSDSPVFETSDSGEIVSTDVEGASGDLAIYAGAPSSSTPIKFLYYNGHGDVAAEADDPSGNRLEAFTYDPFGGIQQTLPASVLVERWAGRWDKQFDSATSLVQMGARPYDPSVGRFLAVDPVEGGGFNNYDYARQDPINGYDLDGRCNRYFADLFNSVVAACQAEATVDFLRRHKVAVAVIAVSVIAAAIVAPEVTVAAAIGGVALRIAATQAIRVAMARAGVVLKGRLSRALQRCVSGGLRNYQQSGPAMSSWGRIISFSIGCFHAIRGPG